MNESHIPDPAPVAGPPKVAFAFAAATTTLLAATGVWFAFAAWADFDTPGHLILAISLVAGLAASVLASVFVWRRQWGWAALAAVAAVLTPTGYAYLGNVLTLVFAVFATVVFVRARISARSSAITAS